MEILFFLVIGIFGLLGIGSLYGGSKGWNLALKLAGAYTLEVQSQHLLLIVGGRCYLVSC